MFSKESFLTPTKFVEKTWGHERWMVNTEKFCGKLLYVEKDKFCSLHYHRLKEENFYVFAGEVKLDLRYPDDKCMSLILTSGDSITVKPGVLHRFTGKCGNSIIIETSTQHFDDDSYRVEPSYGAV